MAEIRVRSVSHFSEASFLSRVFDEMCSRPLPDGEFPVGRSLSWRAFRMMASDVDLAQVCTHALDRREPAIRPDRRLFASFQLSLGIHLLAENLPFTRPQLAILRESAAMQRRIGHTSYPIEPVEIIINAHALHA